MNEIEDNFEALRRLLAFKNRETPPPGYFNDFPARVIASIRAGETKEPSGGWVVKLFQALEFKPAFAGTFAAALCMVLVFGIVYLERTDIASQPSLLTGNAQDNALLATAPATYVPPAETTSLFGSTNPVMNLDSGSYATILNQPSPFMQQVSFNISGN